MTISYFSPSLQMLQGFVWLKAGAPWDLAERWMVDLRAIGFNEPEKTSGTTEGAAQFVQALSVDGTELSIAYLARDATHRLSQASLAWLTPPMDATASMSGAVATAVDALACVWGGAHATLDQVAAWTSAGQPEDEVVASACWSAKGAPAIGPVATPTAYSGALKALSGPWSVTFTPLQEAGGRWRLQALLVV